MRIGFDAKRYFHNQTGLGNFSRSLIQGLSSLGNHNDLFLFNATQRKDTFESAHIHVVSPKIKWPLWRQVGAINHIEKLDLDIYHGLSAELPLFKPRKCKLVVTVHDLIFLKYPSYYGLVDRLIYTYKLRNAVNLADVIICTSRQTKSDLLEIFPTVESKVEIIYQGCDEIYYQRHTADNLDQFTNRHELPKTFLLCVSKFEKRKNHLTLLKAYADLPDEKRLPLILVGKKGDAFDQVKYEIETSSLPQSIRIFTDVSTNDLTYFYQLASWSIFPSLYEGFGIPVLESMASGTPVLTTASSSMQEIVGYSKLLFDPTSVKSISESLILVSGDTNKQAFEEDIKSRLPLFDAAHIASKHIELYQSLIS